MGEDLLTQVRSYERWTRDCERLREITSVCECECYCLEQDLFIGIFRMGEYLDAGGLVFASTRLSVWSGAGFLIGIFRMGEDLLTQVGSDERWTRVCERLREIMSVSYVCLVAFARDWYGWSLWVDHEMGRISCIQTDAGCFVQSMRGSSVGVRWSGL